MSSKVIIIIFITVFKGLVRFLKFKFDSSEDGLVNIDEFFVVKFSAVQMERIIFLYPLILMFIFNLFFFPPEFIIINPVVFSYYLFG